ncbi:hypothetical protein NC652_005357 [Populus alba x Populus x berolinensis]|nr:hypothetical protein NC652_005357 [Populus alba x Populus x berolinensis]
MTRQNPGDPAGRPITRATRANPDETRRFADLGLEILRVGVGKLLNPVRKLTRPKGRVPGFMGMNTICWKPGSTLLALVASLSPETVSLVPPLDDQDLLTKRKRVSEELRLLLQIGAVKRKNNSPIGASSIVRAKRKKWNPTPTLKISKPRSAKRRVSSGFARVARVMGRPAGSPGFCRVIAPSGLLTNPNRSSYRVGRVPVRPAGPVRILRWVSKLLLLSFFLASPLLLAQTITPLQTSVCAEADRVALLGFKARILKDATDILSS